MTDESVAALAAEFRRMSRQISAAPPAVRGIRASLRVPYGKTFKQWDTRSELWVWVNRAALYDAVGPRVSSATAANPFGIPVYHEDHV